MTFRMTVAGVAFAVLAGGQARQPAPDPLAEHGFRALRAPLREIQLGGLIVPGHERLGTVHAEAVRAVTGLKEQPVRPLRLDSQLTFPAGAAALAIESTDRDLAARMRSQCTNASLVTSKLREISASVPRGDAEMRRETLAKLRDTLGVPQGALDQYVIVTSTVIADFEVEDCGDTETSRRVRQAFDGATIGYKAAAPLPTAGALGVQSIIEILKAFELNDVAKDRTLRVVAIESTPRSGELGFTDVVRLGRRAPDTAPDDAFNWIGATPTGPQTLWTGRFFFRLKGAAGARTITRDVSVNDAGQRLTLNYQ